MTCKSHSDFFLSRPQFGDSFALRSGLLLRISLKSVRCNILQHFIQSSDTFRCIWVKLGSGHGRLVVRDNAHLVWNWIFGSPFWIFWCLWCDFPSRGNCCSSLFTPGEGESVQNSHIQTHTCSHTRTHTRTQPNTVISITLAVRAWVKRIWSH